MARKSKDTNQVDELTADIKRIQADFINYRKRVEEEKLHYTKFGRESAVMAILPVLDNFERSFGHIPKNLSGNDWVTGVKAVAKQLEEALKSLGVTRIQSVGQEFNPDLHEALQADDGPGKREVVIEEIQPGYTMDGEVVRHALVKVGRK